MMNYADLISSVDKLVKNENYGINEVTNDLYCEGYQRGLINDPLRIQLKCLVVHKYVITVLSQLEVSQCVSFSYNFYFNKYIPISKS